MVGYRRVTVSTEWWRNAVIYQIYPRSFADSDGDGLGDLPGITARLDHLAELGADAVWLSPFYPSPHADAGYDVSDYRDVDPAFGRLADFDALVALGRRLPGVRAQFRRLRRRRLRRPARRPQPPALPA